MKKIVLFLMVIIIGAIVFLVTSKIYNNNLETAYYSLKFRNIEFNLVDLEGAIKFQEDNNWTNSYDVTEKVDDVIEGINITLIVSKDMGNLTKENENTLNLLRDIISEYDKYGDYPDSSESVSTQDKDAFNKLADDLNKVNWGIGFNYGKDDKEFKVAVNNLYWYQKGYR